MSEYIPQGSILRAGHGLVPDYAAEQMKQQELQLAQLGAAAQAAQVRNQTLRVQSDIEETQRKNARVIAYKADVEALELDPTPQNIARFIRANPEVGEEIRKSADFENDAKAKADFGQLSDIYTSLNSNRPELAISSLERRMAADKAAGEEEDPVDRQMLDDLRSGDPLRVKSVTAKAGAMVAGIFPEKFSETFKALGGDGRKLRTVSAGDVIIDEATAQEVYSSPYKPQLVEGADGAMYEYVPSASAKGGDPVPAGESGGTGLLAKMVPITLGSESGNRDYGPDGRVLTSPAGAQGRMQVMPGTNTDPGYGVTPARDGSLEERARVGRDYLQAMLDKYKSPDKAWAAYNAGPGRLDDAMKSGGANWLSKLPAETRKYVAKNMQRLGGTKTASRATGTATDAGGGRERVIAEARDAIARGAPRASVIARLKNMGVEIGGL